MLRVVVFFLLFLNVTAALGQGVPVSGAVVYQKSGNIYKTTLPQLSTTLLIRNGQYPRWSADGQYLAFLRGSAVMRAKADGSEIQALAGVSYPQAVAYAPSGLEIFFTDRKSIKAVNIASRRVRTVVRASSKFKELDVNATGRQVIATSYVPGGFRVFNCNTVSGNCSGKTAGCAPSFSPDFSLFTANQKGHGKVNLLRYPGGSLVSSLKAPSGKQFDNQFWSNDADWIVAVTEDAAANVLLLRVSNKRVYQVTRSGGVSRPDLFVAPAN